MTFDIERHATTRLEQNTPAPGCPGDPPRWTTGAKTAVGTAIDDGSRVWFTISRGILNEIYFPSIDQANTRTLHFVIVDEAGFVSDERSDAAHHVRPLDSGVPVFQISTRCKQGRYEIEKRILSDPDRDVLLMEVEFRQASENENLHLYALLDPHIADAGKDNEAWVGHYKDIPMLFAQRGETTLALAASNGFEKMSCGFVGVSDGWTDIRRHKRLTWSYTEAKTGNVMVAAELRNPAREKFCLAVGFGGHGAEAGQQARAGLLQNFEALRKCYVNGWREAQNSYLDLAGPSRNGLDLYRVSTAVLQIHESKRFSGAVVAGLSIPWGEDRGDEDIGGYHVIWPRDMVQAALGKLACGDADSARRTLFYLKCTQEHDGKWPQNMWLDGTPNWTATQMDGTAFGIFLADALRRAGELRDRDPWPMIRKAAGFLVRNGPVTEQERWEEDPGYSPNTMAVEIAALLGAADFADERDGPAVAEFLRATADAWNDDIDELTYAHGTQLARQFDVDGYYIRISPPEVIQTGLRDDTLIHIKNLPESRAEKRAVDIVSPDALALVRFGLRAADDPRILNTVKIIDATLKKELSNGPIWYRYTADGYGEHRDGSPFKDTGQGRGWPLLAGERGHYEVARGNFEFARQLLETMAAQTSECGLLPEQVWDAEDLPEKNLFNGQPTGSGMPLVWAHAEYIRLLRSVNERKVWDMPPQPVERYQKRNTKSPFKIWTFEQQRSGIPSGRDLRIDCRSAAKIRWSIDHWKTTREVETIDSGLGVHYALLNTAGLRSGSHVHFAFFSIETGQWSDRKFEVGVI